MSQCPREKSAFLFDTEVASVIPVVVHLSPSVVHKKKNLCWLWLLPSGKRLQKAIEAMAQSK